MTDPARLQVRQSSKAECPDDCPACGLVNAFGGDPRKVEAERDRYRRGLELIVRESEQFPAEDGIGAGTMARNILNG